MPASRAYIATLGTEPQVVTVPLFLRLQQDVAAYEQVIIVHTRPNDQDPNDKMRLALHTLSQELQAFKANGKIGQFYFVELQRDGGQPITDIYDYDDADAVFTTIRRIIGEQKQAGRNLDVNAAGGRKAMSSYAMAVAQIYFEEGDNLWLLASSSAFQSSRKLYPDSLFDVQLIRLPVRVMRGLLPEDLRRRREFLEQLTEREHQIVERIARYRETNGEVAAALGIAEKNVENRLSNEDGIFVELRRWLGRPNVGRGDLIAEFGLYFEAHSKQ